MTFSLVDINENYICLRISPLGIYGNPEKQKKISPCLRFFCLRFAKMLPLSTISRFSCHFLSLFLFSSLPPFLLSPSLFGINGKGMHPLSLCIYLGIGLTPNFCMRYSNVFLGRGLVKMSTLDSFVATLSKLDPLLYNWFS